MAKFAVIIRDRHAEGLRMSVGLTVLNDMVEIFLIEPLIDDESIEAHLEAIKDLNLKIYSVVPGIKGLSFEHISPEIMADKLLGYDKVLPY